MEGTAAAVVELAVAGRAPTAGLGRRRIEPLGSDREWGTGESGGQGFGFADQGSFDPAKSVRDRRI
jgi:hypothetical protein